MSLSVCSKCLEPTCHCERYRKRFPKEWAMRDKLGHAPWAKLGEPPRILLDDIDIICIAANER